MVAPEGAATTIALVPAGLDRQAGGGTGIRLATDDAARLHADLRGRGVAVGELLTWPGVPPMFTIEDPDGNGLSVTDVPTEG